MNYQNVFLICVLQLFALSGCATFKGLFGFGKKSATESEELAQQESGAPADENDASDSKNHTPGKVRPATGSELELKIAKLWARVDELEERSKRQREHIKVLEKGLMLGLLPDELVNPEDRKLSSKPGAKSAPLAHEKSHQDHEDDIGKNAPVAPLEAALAASAEHTGAAPTAPAASGRELTAEENLEFNKQLAIAQDQFQSGRYGRAIADFSTLAKNFPEETKDGNYKYWIALSWSNLKEYESAQKEFAEFIKSYPNNPWLPRAEFNLAKVEIALGFRERGIERLRRVIKSHPQEDASEMAKLEISNLEKSL
jgi:TolA-binding protein